MSEIKFDKLLIVVPVFVVLVTILSFALSAEAADRFASVGGTDSGNCTSLLSPCASIQYAINQSVSGDTIKVAQGTYSENINLEVSISSFLIQGGWNSSFSMRSDDPSLTIIDGGNSDRVFDINKGSTEIIEVTLEGFTLKNGSAYSGGGIHLSGTHTTSFATVTLKNNVIEYNEATNAHAGGISTDISNLTLTLDDNVIRNNKGQNCGGVFVRIRENGSVTMTDNEFMFNSTNNNENVCVEAFNNGSLTVTLENNVISNNMSGTVSFFTGGGLSIQGSTDSLLTALLQNNIIADNEGTGLNFRSYGTLSATVTNNTVTGNSANWGGGILVTSVSSDEAPVALTVDIVNSIVWGNIATSGNGILIIEHENSSATVNATYSDIENVSINNAYGGDGTYNDNGNNINTDPLFVNPANLNYHLSLFSPLINMGNNSAASSIATDFEGDPRMLDGTVDIGADEYNLLTADSDNDGIPDDGDGSGAADDTPCAGGNRENCDDNCPAASNPDQDDMDADGVGDVCDNCREVENWDQMDSNYPEDDNPGVDDYQHYGNACDADYDNNGTVGLEDFNELRTWFGQSVPPAPAYIDCDDDGAIGLGDFNCLRTYFGKSPGPGIGD